jgi:hypothetical protein
MAAALLWARTNLRSQWRSAALVVLIAAVRAAVAKPSDISPEASRAAISYTAVPHPIARSLRSE